MTLNRFPLIFKKNCNVLISRTVQINKRADRDRFSPLGAGTKARSQKRKDLLCSSKGDNDMNACDDFTDQSTVHPFVISRKEIRQMKRGFFRGPPGDPDSNYINNKKRETKRKGNNTVYFKKRMG